MSDVLTTDGLSFGYGLSPVLRELDLRVGEGSVYGLLGRNGSGKTTLARLLLGMLRPSGGRCLVLGLDPVADALAIRCRVGYVPQESDFDPRMSVEGMLRFLRGFFPDQWRDDLVVESLRRFGLVGLQKNRIRELSGGMRQRLALAAALAIDPEILILDEPTAGLDAVVRRQFAESVIEFTARGNRTVLLLSHLLHEVERLADHVGILRDGALYVEAPVEQLKHDFLRVSARLERPPKHSLPGFVGARQIGERWQISAWARGDEERDRFLRLLEQGGARDLSLADSSLESIFVDLVAGDEDV